MVPSCFQVTMASGAEQNHGHQLALGDTRALRDAAEHGHRVLVVDRGGLDVDGQLAAAGERAAEPQRRIRVRIVPPLEERPEERRQKVGHQLRQRPTDQLPAGKAERAVAVADVDDEEVATPHQQHHVGQVRQQRAPGRRHASAA